MIYVPYVIGKMIIFKEKNPNYQRGANDISLNEACENYKRIGAISEEY